jgi:hypothetical protein
MVHGDATQIEQHGIDLCFEGLASWCGADKLIATLLTELLGFAGGRAVVDEAITLALGTYTSRYTPSQTWAYLSKGDV